MKNDKVSDETMGRNEYARHQGCTPNAVLKAARDGRIARAVIWGPGRKIQAIRWRLADELWEKNTDHVQGLRTRTQLGPGPGAGASPAVHTSARPAAPAPESGPSPSSVELALCQALNNSVIGVVALMIAEGVSGATALKAFDYVVVAVFTVLEEQLGREALILLQGNLQALNDDVKGRPLLIKRAEAVALTLADDLSDGAAPAN